MRATDDVYTPPDAHTVSRANTPRLSGDSSPDANKTHAETIPSGSSDTAATDDAPGAEVDATPPTEDGTELPPTHPQRAQARHDRIVELSERIEALLEENDRLRAELETERQRRQQLEATVDDASDGWWPFTTK